MAERHITEELLQRFLRNQTEGQETRQVVRHLLRSCPECSEMTQRVRAEIGPWAAGQQEEDASYDEAFERALFCVMEEEQRFAA